MKKLISFLSVFLVCISAEGSFSNLYGALVDVNARWAFESDYSPELFDLPSEKNPIQTHLFLVQNILNSRSTHHLSVEQKQNRLSLLQVLKHYAERNEFPKNNAIGFRNPVFIDEYGTHCAVGFLIKESGNTELAKRISRNMNYEYLLNMKDSELSRWVEKSGFSASELAWIQPGYPPVGDAIKMGNGTNGRINAMISFNNEIIASGQFDTAGVVAADGISSWISGIVGFDWVPIGQSGLKYEVYDLEEFNGGLVAAGNILYADTTLIGSSVAFWDGSNWNAMGAFYIGALQNEVFDLEVFNNELYAAGHFKSAFNASTYFRNFAKWDGTEWVSAGFSPEAEVTALKVHKGRLILGGAFTNIDSISCNHIAFYDGNNYGSLGAGVESYVYALESVGDTLFAGGELLSSTKQDTFGLSYYVNDQWTRVKGFDYSLAADDQKVWALEDTPYGLFVGGNINYFPLIGTYSKNLLRYENGNIIPFAVLDSTVRAIEYANHKLYVGGEFIKSPFTAQSQNLNHVAYFDLANTFNLNDFQERNNVKLYPNPNRGEFSIELDEQVQINEIEVVDISGRAVAFERRELAESKIQLKITKSSTSLYIIRMKTDKGLLERKFIVQP